MEPENKTHAIKKDYSLPISIIVAAAFIAGAWVYSATFKSGAGGADSSKTTANLLDTIAPVKGFVLPIDWGDLGTQLAQTGIIDTSKFEQLLASRGEFGEDIKRMLYGKQNKKTTITPANSAAILNLFWALGLGNKNEILERGPMAQYGNTDRFASTGGWTMAKDNPMMHYNMHRFIELTPDQQKLVGEVSQNIYRPCCNNPTHFPDCNHGMAMLGLLELMASQGASKEKMYETALKVNSYWFPDQYLTIAKFLKTKGIDWGKSSPEKILGKEFSSASGFQWVSEQTAQPEESERGGGCAV